jgi:anti-anti-sigma factor
MTPSLPLHFTASTEPGGVKVLHVHGEVDLATADRLRERLLAEFARHPRLVVDLSSAMLFDAAALRALRALHAKAAEQRREPPVLRGVRPLLARTLTNTGLRALFTLEPARPAARPFPAASASPSPSGRGRPPRRASAQAATAARPASAAA